MFYGFVAIIAVGIIYCYRSQMRHRLYLLYGLGGLFLMGLGIRAMLSARERSASEEPRSVRNVSPASDSAEATDRHSAVEADPQD